GDRDAYRILVERHSKNVYRLAYRMAGNSHDAEEIVQEAFLRGYQKLKQFAGQANFGTWVYRIAANYAIDRIRQRKVEDSRRELPNRESEEGQEIDPVPQINASAPPPGRLAGRNRPALRMQQALQQLPPAEPPAIVRRNWEGGGIEKTATFLKPSPTAAKNTVFRAVQKLRVALE